MCLAVGTNSDQETPVRLSRPARLAVLPPSTRRRRSSLSSLAATTWTCTYTPRARCVGPLFLTAVLCRRARAARPPFSLSIRDVLCCSQSVSVPLLTRPRYTSSARACVCVLRRRPCPVSSSSSSTYRRGPSMQLSPSAYYTSTTLEH